MAINIYGSCSGSSGSKYDIWLNVKQNSQSIEDNKSNVTVYSQANHIAELRALREDIRLEMKRLHSYGTYVSNSYFND